MKMPAAKGTRCLRGRRTAGILIIDMTALESKREIVRIERRNCTTVSTTDRLFSLIFEWLGMYFW